MSSDATIQLAQRAQDLYNSRYRALLEAAHADEFVAIEPDSGDYFLGHTLSEAIQAARSAHPDRMPFTMRVGHKAAVALGMLVP